MGTLQGVTYDPKRKNYKARIHYAGREVYIGRYNSSEAAAFAYDQAARYINAKAGAPCPTAFPTEPEGARRHKRARPLNFPDKHKREDPRIARRLQAVLGGRGAAAAAAAPAAPAAAAGTGTAAAADSTDTEVAEDVDGGRLQASVGEGVACAQAAAGTAAVADAATCAAAEQGWGSSAAHGSSAPAAAVQRALTSPFCELPTAAIAQLLVAQQSSVLPAAAPAHTAAPDPNQPHHQQQQEQRQGSAQLAPVSGLPPGLPRVEVLDDPEWELLLAAVGEGTKPMGPSSTSTATGTAGATATAPGYDPSALSLLLAAGTEPMRPSSTATGTGIAGATVTAAGFYPSALNPGCIYSSGNNQQQSAPQMTVMPPLQLLFQGASGGASAPGGVGCADPPAAAAGTETLWGGLMQRQASSSDSGSGQEATPAVLPAASGAHSMGHGAAAMGAVSQAAAGWDDYSPLSSSSHHTAVAGAAAVGNPADAGAGAAYTAALGDGFGSDVYSVAGAAGASGSPSQSQPPAYWAPAGLQPPPLLQLPLHPPTAAQNASEAQQAAGAAATADWVGAGPSANTARGGGGLFSGLQSPRQVLCVANRVLHHLLDLQGYLEAAQQQQLLRFGSFNVLTAMSDWLQAAWYVDVVADGNIEPVERPAAAAAAIAGAKAATSGSASPNKLALQLLDRLLVVCMEELGLHGQQDSFAAAARGPMGHQVVSEVIQGLQQGLIAVQYQLSGWKGGHQGAGVSCRELLQAYAAAAIQGCGGGGFNSPAPHVLMRLAQLL